MAQTAVTSIPKRAAKAVVHFLVRNYWNGWLYTIDARMSPASPEAMDCYRIEDVSDIAASPYEELRRQAWKQEPDTCGFAARLDGEVAAVCWFQAREAHRRHGGLFDLADDEAELVQVTTAGVFRGRGVARHLIQYAVAQMGMAGYRRLYAKIWHDNIESIRAFTRAGWQLQTRFLSVEWRFRRRPMLLRLPKTEPTRSKRRSS